MENKVNAYKKSYKEFLLLVVGYLAISVAAGFLFRDLKKLALVEMFITHFFVFLLSFFIVVFDRVYWYMGIDFKRAQEVGRKRRMDFSFKHFKVAFWLMGLMIVYTIFSFVFDFSDFWDIFIPSVLILSFPVSTYSFKL